MKRHLHFISQPHGSIGEISTDLTPFLKEAFIYTEEGSNEPEQNDILLCHFLIPAILDQYEFRSFKKKVLIQPIDGTHLYPKFIDMINKFDLIITPGKAGKRIMIENGVTKPIEVIKNFFKEDIFNVENTEISQLPSDRFIFYHESTFHNRKGIDLLYESFITTFSDKPYTNDIILLLKDSPFNSTTFKTIEALKEKTIKLQKQYKNPAKIIKISQSLPFETMKKIWMNIDCYISLSKIEGFGIPLLRMAALHKPLIILDSNLSGSADWLTKDTAYMIPTKNVLAKDEPMYLYDPKYTQWSVPLDNQDINKTLIKAYDDIKLNKQKLVPNNIIETMTIKNIAKNYVEVLQKV